MVEKRGGGGEVRPEGEGRCVRRAHQSDWPHVAWVLRGSPPTRPAGARPADRRGLARDATHTH